MGNHKKYLVNGLQMSTRTKLQNFLEEIRMLAVWCVGGGEWERGRGDICFAENNFLAQR